MTLSHLALGDSYTIGEGIAASGRWSLQLAAALRQLRIPLRDPHIIAQTGWTTDELAHAVETAALPECSQDFVTLLAGVNDQYRQRPLTEFATGFDALLHQAERLCKHGRQGVMVLSLPDWGVTPFARREGRDATRIAHELDAYNAHIQTVCAARGIAFIDITSASRAAGDAADMLAADGLHPSANQYAEWARLALMPARTLLERMA